MVVQVWSSDSGTTHNPPSDIVMKGKRWFVSEEMKTILLDTDEEVSAMRLANFPGSSSVHQQVSSLQNAF